MGVILLKSGDRSIARRLLAALAAFAVAAAPGAVGAQTEGAPAEPPTAVTPAPLPGPAADRILRLRSEAILDDPAALLRAATDAIADEDFAHADWLYEQLGDRHPIVGDHAGLRRARLHLADDRQTTARQIARTTLARFKKSPLRMELHQLIGDSMIAEKNEAGGRAAYSAALSETRDGERRAALLRLIARSEERSGQDRAAGTTWRLLWYSHPTTPEAEQAAHRLDLIETHLGETLRDATIWRKRGDQLFRKRDNDGALVAFDRALELGLSSAETRRTRKQRAQTLFRMRRYPDALAAYAALPQTGDTPIWHARSLARADRVPESIAAFRKLAKKGGPHALRAHYYAALLLDGRKRDDEARVHFDKLARDPKKGGLAQGAIWRLGWSAYRNGRLDEAKQRFDSLTKATRDPIDQLRPRYWSARAMEPSDPAAARAQLGSLAEDYPLTYYGWRARERLGGAAFERRAHEIRPGTSALPPEALARVRILMEAGLSEDGARESADLIRKARGLEDRVELARLLTSAGDFNRAQRVVVDAYKGSLARGPLSGLEELWWYAWPSAFSDHVTRATEEPDAVDSELVYSIMREESGYRPKVVSPVGARGLLQIMRETGKQLASQRGRKSFDPDELFDPKTNIELGSFYLGELRRTFPTQLSASIASYNAGPHVVRNWVEAERPDDEWVETIPYSQTRSYVKRVLRSVQAYRLLY